MKKKISKAVSRLLFLVALIGTTSTAHALPFNNIVIFGDSLSDTGNLFADAGVPGAPYYSGQFSNGPVWASLFAQHFGLEAKASNAGGTNYAYAGATTGPTGIPSSAPTLLTQEANYLASTGGIADPNALYVVFGGANDLADALLTSNPSLIGNGISNVVNIVTSLYGAGAKNLLLVNTPDIGKTPRVATFGSAVQGAGTMLSNSWNSALDAALTSLGVLPGLDLDLLDLFDLQQTTLADPASFGFTNMTDPCFNGVTVCGNPDEYFFWDDFHPGAKAQQLIALATIDVVTGEVPEPSAILLLGMGLMAMIVIRRRTHKTTHTDQI